MAKIRKEDTEEQDRELLKHQKEKNAGIEYKLASSKALGCSNSQYENFHKASGMY